MSVEEQVDRLLQKDDKKVVVKHFKFNRKHFFIAFGSMVVTALLFTMLVVPVSREWMEETFFGAREQTTVPSAGGTIVNDSVTWSNDYGTLTVTPDVSRNIITQEQEALFESNITADIDLAFRFDEPLTNKDIWRWRNISHNVSVPDYGYITANYTLINISDFEVIGEPDDVMLGDIPSDYYAVGNASFWDDDFGEWLNTTFTIGFDSWSWLNSEHTQANFTYEYWGHIGNHLEEQYWFDWKDVSGQFNHQLYAGKHYYYVSDVPVVQGNSYLFKWQYDIPLVNFKSSGKWDLMAKLHSDDIPTALSSGRYIMIDPWWDSDWSYSKIITVTNPIEDYQTVINVTKTSGGDVDCEGHCNDDFSDIRFVNSTNTTELPYWIENFTSGVVAKIWVNNTWNESTINLYYGNASATNNSDGNVTFDFFDGFYGSSLDGTKWNSATGGDGAIAVSGGRARFTASSANANYVIIDTNALKNAPVAVRFLGINADAIGVHRWELATDTGTGNTNHVRDELYDQSTGGGGGNSDIHGKLRINAGNKADTFRDLDVGDESYDVNSLDLIVRNDRKVAFKIDDVSKGLSADALDDDSWRIKFWVGQSDRGNHDSYVDAVLMRKYNETEQTFSFGSEQSRDTVTITLIDYMPANIRTNNTGSAWFLYNITTNSTSINSGSIVWAYGVNHTVSITRNTSYSLEDHLAKNKLRGNNRNENITIESKFNATAGDGSIGELGEWNVHELGNDVTIVDSGSNWTLVNASEPITEHLFSSISFVDNEDINLENKTTQTLNIYKRNLVKIEFNMTDTGWYDDGHYKNSSMFVHIYANETDANRPLNIFYANSSYTTGDVTNSLYCELVGEVIPNEAYHFTIENSSYYEKDFIINVTGFVGSVNATSKYYIILQSETTSSKPWFLHYADGNDTHTVGGDSHYHDFDNRTIVNVTSDDGGSWSANSSTPDVYFNYISLDEEDASEVKLYANDTSGNSAWSSVHTDIIDITNYAPSPANIHIPNVNTNYTVGDTIPINYNWIGDPNLDTCWVNISLWDWTRSVLQSYIVNQSITNAERMANNSNFTYNWDTTGVSRSNYTIAINITDGSMWANHSSDIFWLSLWQVINGTINGSIFNQSQISIINNSINGSLYNTSQITTFNNTINGSLYNQSVGLNTTVDTISPYNQTASPLAITASSYNETPDNVTLYYRYSSDNSTWDNESAGAITNQTFGYDSAGTDTVDIDDIIRGVSRISPSSNGTVDNISVYIHIKAGTYPVKCAVYWDSNNTYMCLSEEKNLTGNNWRWETFNITGTWRVRTNEEYIIVAWSNSTQTEMRFVNPANGYWSWRDDHTYNGWANPTVATAENEDMAHRILCYYTESGGGNENWTFFGTDETAPWNWSFNFPNSTGYYEFYSIANLSGQANETAPDYNDTLCYFDLAVWQVFNNTINGTIYNSSVFSIINNTINGTVYNGTGIVAQWQIINNTINGSLFNRSLGLNTTVDTITPYNQTVSPLEITATSYNETPDNVTLYYRYSSDNITWGEAGSESYFGNTVEEDGGERSIENYIVGSAFSPSTSGTTDNIWVRLYRGSDWVGGNVTCMIYNNATDALVGTSEEILIPAYVGTTRDWFIFNVTCDVVADTEYLLTVWSELASGTLAVCQAAGSSLYRDSDTYDGVPPNPIVRSYLAAENVSIYCNYTDAATSGLSWTEFEEDTISPWNWSFNFPNSTGYYEFYSIANLSGQANESAPDYKDTLCYFNLKEWSVFSNTINGSLFNGSGYTRFSNIINGSLYNGTGVIFPIINNTINGSLYNTSDEEIDPGTNYYVANAGNDTDDGLTPATAWRTIVKVRTEMNGGDIHEGDNVWFNRGDAFNDGVLTLRALGGTADNYMVIGAYGSGAKPIFNYGGGTRVGCTVACDHLRMENLNFTGTTSGGSYNINFDNGCGASYIELYQVDCYGLNQNFIGVRDTDYYKIENCNLYVGNPNDHGIAIGRGASNGIIRNCTVNTCKDGIQLHFGSVEANNVDDNHWIENCVVINARSDEEAIDIVGGVDCNNVLVQNCEIYGSGGAGLTVGHSTQDVVIDNVTIRDQRGEFVAANTKNVIFRNNIRRNWADEGKGIVKSEGAGATAENIIIYNNDFVSYGHDQYMVVNDDLTYVWTVKNNIFYTTPTGDTSPIVFVDATLAEITASFSYNMYWAASGLTGSHWQDSGGSYTFAQWNAKDEVSNELRDDPELTDPTNGDYTLSDTSPCIDAGDWLTTTDGGGTGTTITVDESNYFFPGLPTLGVDGDNIFVGDDTDLEVTAVNYDGETITVNRSITWTDGEDVSLSNYLGSKVDIGAREYSSASYWQSVSSTLNGTLFNGSKRILFSNINGSLWNVSLMHVFSNTYNGSIYNLTQFNIISDTYNGSLYNISVVYMRIISDTYNGSLYNGTELNLLFSDVNGSLWNISDYVEFSDIINGVIYNATPYITIQNDINGSIFNISLDPFIDNVYPANGSNILVVQPTVYFNLTSPLGNLMNYSIYIGSSAGSCNTLLFTGTNVTNGTQFDGNHLYYSAVNFSTSYWWRIAVTDGTASINETFYFQSLRQGGGGVTGYGAAMAIATGALMLVVVVFALVMDKKRKERI